MAAPTLTSQAGSNWTDISSTDTTGTLTWGTGDRILVVAVTEDQSATFNTPTATGLTFSALGTAITASSSCWIHAWEATAASPGSSTVVATALAGGSAARGIHAFAWGGCTGFVRTNLGTQTSTETISITRTQANSGIVFWSADWSASGSGGLGWTPAGQTQVQAAAHANYTAFAASWGDQGSTGTTAYGTTGLAGTKFSVSAVEVLGTVSGSNFTRTVDDSAGLTDAAAAVSSFTRAQTDTAGLVDSTSSAVAFARTVDDTAGLTDAALAALAAARTVDDGVGLTDSATPVLTSGSNFTRTVDDLVGLTDAAASAADFARSQTDTAGVTDSVVAASSFARTQTDTAGLTDASVVAVAFERVVTDTAGLIDSASTQLAGAGTRTVDDSIGLTDSVSYSSTQTLTDSLGLVDAATLAMAAARTASDSLGLTDTVTAALTRSVTVTDSAGLTDSVSTVVSVGNAYVRVITDSVGLTSEHQVRQVTARPFTGVTTRPSSGVTARPYAGVTSRYPFVPD